MFYFDESSFVRFLSHLRWNEVSNDILCLSCDLSPNTAVQTIIQVLSQYIITNLSHQILEITSAHFLSRLVNKICPNIQSRSTTVI
jgi:hypothetical protein